MMEFQVWSRYCAELNQAAPSCAELCRAAPSHAKLWGFRANVYEGQGSHWKKKDGRWAPELSYQDNHMKIMLWCTWVLQGVSWSHWHSMRSVSLGLDQTCHLKVILVAFGVVCKHHAGTYDSHWKVKSPWSPLALCSPQPPNHRVSPLILQKVKQSVCPKGKRLEGKLVNFCQLLRISWSFFHSHTFQKLETGSVSQKVTHVFLTLWCLSGL